MTQATLPFEKNKTVEQVTSDQPPQSPAVINIPERPRLAPNVQLVGEMQGTGFQDRQWLIQRDGQFIQLTELLYRVAEQANGKQTLEEMATGVTESTEWAVTAEHIHQLLKKLIPLGLIATADGSAPAQATRQRSPLQVNMRLKTLDPNVIEPIAKVLQVLYNPPILTLFLITIALAHGWLYFSHGVADSVRDVLYTPGLLLVSLVIIIAAGVFHEFGHAAALCYGGGQVRGMGMGLYLIYPAFYTDVTDSYRLGRWARVRTDLGGIYFHLVFTLIIMALYFVSGQEFLLFVVMIIDLEIIRQFIPLIRMDGYWLLADLTGIPDFFSQMGPFLRSLLPVNSKGAKLPQLKPWVKAVFLAYIILTIPMLALFFFLMVKGLPYFMAITWDSLLNHLRIFSIAQSQGDFLALAAVASQIFFLMLPLVGTLYFLYIMSLMPAQVLWRWSTPSPLRRVGGVLLSLAILALLAFLWVPQLTFVMKSTPEGVQRFNITERSHLEGTVTYPQVPPVGGDHAPVWQNCGFYDVPVASENAVHSLEHGAVWITYRPNLSPEEIEALRQQANRQPYVLVSPFPDLPAPVVASAWGHQLSLDSATDPRLDQFIRAFRLGSQAPEPGEACTGGTGVPE
jgi:putative peptide zinc metalloprotease protein